VKVIDGAAFARTGLMSVTIPNCVTKIKIAAFSGCAKLEAVTISRSVTSIGMWAFTECDNLTSFTSLNPVPPNIERGEAFYGKGGTTDIITLYVPSSSVSAYRQANGWSGFRHIQPMKTN
jgi:hypothetical protein